MIKCPVCNLKLQFTEGEYRCPICKKTWDDILITDKKYIDTQIKDKYNSLIAYEYYKLETIIKNR